jgi:hypothetical protein
MVKLTIMVEGAILPHHNVAAATISNAAAFREAFRKLLQSGITNPELSIQVMNGGPDRNAVKMFLNSAAYQVLLIDLEGRPNTRLQRLESFHDLGFDIQVHAGNTFFMVQKMEAWFLSQPDKIELLLAKKKVTTHTLANDDNLLNRHPESIVHPDNVLNVILMGHFEENRNGRRKKMKYSGKKLTLAPQLLEILDIERLRGTFSDVRDLLEKLNGHNQ